MSQENVEAVRSAFDAINRRDAEALLKATSPDITQDWSRAIGPVRGVFRGQGQVLDFLRSWWDVFDESVFIVDDLIDAGDQVVATCHGRQRGRGSGVVVEGRGFAMVWSFVDGKATSVTLYQQRSEALDAVGLTE